jgi:ABC-2 type transport system permease protein
MKLARHSWYLALRHNRALFRQPIWIALTLFQPLIWLLLYGQLFKRVVDLPGFGVSSYITFLTPGIVCMSAMFSSGWQGMGVIRELDSGVIDRFLVSPASRAAIIVGRLASLALTIVMQTSILLSVGFVMGARYPGGLAGVAALFACSILLAMLFGSLSLAMGLTVRKEESLIGAVNFLLLPLTFLSPVFMSPALMPGWIQVVANFNPVNWAVTAARAALMGTGPLDAIALRMALLAACGVLGAAVATSSFRAYQRSV